MLTLGTITMKEWARCNETNLCELKTTVEMIGISRALSPSQLFYTMSKMFTIGELKKKVKSAED